MARLIFGRRHDVPPCPCAASMSSVLRVVRGLLVAVVVAGYGPAAIAAQSATPRLPPASTVDPVALAERYESAESVPRDYRQALILYCQEAQRGDPRALFNLGWMYLNGRGVARDDATAVMWMRKAAQRGVPQAANIVALLSGVRPGRERDCPAGGAAGASLAKASPAIRSLVDEAAKSAGVNSQLLLSVIAVESGFNPRAVSPKQAAGLMQLMPETAARFGVRDRFDPHENLRGGASYLRSLLQMFSGNLTLALAAYNAGEATVISRGNVVPPYRETLNYIAAVKRLCGCGK